MLLDVIHLDHFSSFQSVLGFYDIISCDLSCDHSIICLFIVNKKKRNSNKKKYKIKKNVSSHMPHNILESAYQTISNNIWYIT